MARASQNSFCRVLDPRGRGERAFLLQPRRGCLGGRTPPIFRTVGDGEYIFHTKSMSGSILLAFCPCPLAVLWPAPLGPAHVSGLEGAFSTPSSELGRRWAVYPPAFVHMRELRAQALCLSSLSFPVWKPLCGPSRLRLMRPKVGRNPGILAECWSGGAPERNADQDSRARGQGSGLEKGWKKVPVPKDVKLTRPRGKLTLIYLSNNMADLAEPGRDSSRLRQTCQRGDRSCRPPVPRGT